ncbi:MAG: hypothetical protein U0840_08445 [Gemmataceae bacterium]
MMKRQVLVAIVLLALTSVGRGQDAKLTGDQARKLLPAAAGIRNADFEALMKDRKADAVESKSLSLVILTLRPRGNPDAAMKQEFRMIGEAIKVSDITQAMWVSREQGYASFLQPDYITACTVTSTAERAEGVVTFQSDYFAGRIPFVAKATKGGWVITEFRMPRYKIRVVRGKDGLWSQEALKDR